MLRQSSPLSPGALPPTQAQVDEVHAKLLVGIEAVFEQHKVRCGFGEAKLSIC